MTLYKWLLADNTTPVQKKPWPCPLGEWTAHETPILCESGWHGVEAKDVLEHLPKVSTPPVLYEVEARGVLLRGDDKFACESMRLVRRVGAADVMLLVKFALVGAESSLGNFEKVFPNDPRVRDCIEVTWRFTRGEATAQEVETAAESARSAAMAAAKSAWAAESAGSAAWSAWWSAEWAASTAATAAARSAESAWRLAVSAADFKAEASQLLVYMIEEANQ
jgi:hypothetical protein